MANYDRLNNAGLLYYTQKLKPKVLGTTITGTLSAGATSLQLSNSAIKTTSLYDVYTDKWGVCPKNVTVSNGSMTLTFDAQTSAVSVKVIVKEA